MHLQASIFAAVLAWTAVASPLGAPAPGCVGTDEYDITSTSPQPVKGLHPTVASVDCAGDEPGCSLSASNSYSVTTGVTVGASLGLEFDSIFKSAGLSVGYVYTTTSGTIDGSTITCPKGPWTCAIKITPWVTQVSGTKTSGQSGPACGNDVETEPFTVEFPQILNNVPAITTDLCACTNAPSFDAPGAPPACPVPC